MEVITGIGRQGVVSDDVWFLNEVRRETMMMTISQMTPKDRTKKNYHREQTFIRGSHNLLSAGDDMGNQPENLLNNTLVDNHGNSRYR
jgi:hypothetical protein